MSIIWRSFNGRDTVEVDWASDEIAVPADGKVPVRYVFRRDGEVVHQDTDLRVPPHDSLMAAMRSLAGFLDAWHEAFVFNGRGGTSDNMDLFPAVLEAWADDNAEYFYADTREEP